MISGPIPFFFPPYLFNIYIYVYYYLLSVLHIYPNKNSFIHFRLFFRILTIFIILKKEEEIPFENYKYLKQMFWLGIVLLFIILSVLGVTCADNYLPKDCDFYVFSIMVIRIIH